MENPKLSVRKHKQKMFLESAERTNHYGLRKLSIGTASVLLSTMLWMGTNGAVASADTVDSQPATTETTKASSDTGTATEEKATNASTAYATATSTTSANATAATSTSEDNAATNVAASLATATSENQDSSDQASKSIANSQVADDKTDTVASSAKANLVASTASYDAVNNDDEYSTTNVDKTASSEDDNNTSSSEADNTPEETTSTNEQTGLVHHKKVQSTTTIAYKTKYVADYNMMIGYRDIKQDGQDGKTVTYLEWDEDASGNKTNETTSEETTPAVDEIYAIGTAEGTPAIDKYQTTYVNNRNLEKGTQVVKQKGQDGFSVYYHDVDPDTGEVDFDQRKEINIQRVDEIIEVGTKIPYTETKHMTFRWVDVSTGKTIVEKQITAKVGETINLGDFAEYPEGYTGLEYEWWDGSTTKFPQFKSDSQIAPKNFNGTMADNGWMPKTFVVQNSIMDYSKYKLGDLEGYYQGYLMTLPETDLDNYVYVAPAIKASDIYKRTRTINLHKPDGTIETTVNVKTFTIPSTAKIIPGAISLPLWDDSRLDPDLKAVPYTDSETSGIRYYDTTGDLIIDTGLQDKSWVVNPTKWAELQRKYESGFNEPQGEKLVPFNWITDTTNEVVPYVYNTDIGKIMPIESSPDLTEEERDKLTEEERNQIDNLDWITSGTWNGYITPQITGWRATRDSVDAYDPKFSDKDVVIDIYYVADPANGDITYIDDTTGKTLNKSDFEEGKVDGLINYTTADKIADYEKQGYKLVSNDFEDGSTKFKVDGNNYFVHLVHTYEDKTLYKKATQTVHYVDNKGAKVFDDKVQSDGQAFTATQTIDKVTGEVVKTTDWTGTKTFGQEDTPFKEGYHADKKVAGGLTATVDNPDVEDTVVYTPNGKLIPVDPNGNEIPDAPTPTYPTDPHDPTKVVPNEPIPEVPNWTPVDPSPVTPTDPGKDTPVPYRQQVTGDITYFDDTTGKTLTHDDFKTGLVGDKVEYTTSDKIKSYEDKGYKLVSNDFEDGKTSYKKDGNSYEVHLVHTYEDKTLYKGATQTVHYVDNTGKQVFEDKKQVDSQAFTATQTIDKVTGEVVKTTDWAGTKTFGQEDTPFKEGYHADKKVAGGLTATVDNPDVEDTVVYTPNGKLIPVDPNGNEIPNAPTPTYPTDPNDPTKVVPDEPIPEVPNWTPVDPSPVTPEDPGKDTPVPYRQQVNGDITYFDDTTGKTLTHDDFKTGLVGDKVEYTTSDKIKSYEDKGYKLVSNDFSDGTTAYKKDGNSYAVHLVHTYEDKTLYKGATQTVHYVDNTGKQVFEDKKQADSQAFTATQTIDKVTGEVVKTTDWTGTKTFGEEATPFKEGYHADKKVAGGLTATVDNPDVEDTVVFTKDEMPSEPVKPTTPDTPDVPEKTYGLTEYFVDEDDNELVPSENKGTNYKSGDKYDVTGDAKEIPGYKLVKTVYTTGTFENDDKMAVFIYKKVKEPAINKYSLTERFVDEDGNEISPSENKGNDFKTGDTFDVSLDGKSINGYKLTRSEGTIGTFTDSDKVATFIYKKETPSKPETPAATVVTKETHEAIRTIRVHYPDGKIDTIREVGHVERTVTTNTVTGEKIYGDWTTDTWEEFESPELEGWKADINIVMEEKVYFDTKDEVVDIHYTKDVDPEKPIIPSKPETPNKSNVPTETPNNKTPEPQKATPAKEEPKTQAATLPQTGEESNKSMGVLGLLMMGASSMLGLLGAKKKRKDEE